VLAHGSPPRVLADLCAGLLVGRLHARGVSGPDSLRVRERSYAWPALRAELDVALRLFERVWAVASLSPLRGLQPVTLTATEREHAQAEAPLPRAGVLLGLGLAYEFHRQGSAVEEHR
jgi:hypothetical protein